LSARFSRQDRKESAREVVYECGGGLAVQAKTVVAGLSKKGRKEVRTFAPLTDEVLQLVDWLVKAGGTQVAIESTGVDWKPVFNILEGVGTVILVNARPIKAVPGRKTDVRACEWLADLLGQGLLKASFIPPVEIRELRELTRYRPTLVTEHTAGANRLQKLREGANIKLGQVASDVLGLRGRLMLRALADGEQDAAKRAELAPGKLKSKQSELRRALEGRLTQTQRWVLTELRARLDELEAALTRVETRLGEEGAACPDPVGKEAVERLDSIPGVGERTAQPLSAAIGVDMSRFPSAKPLARWAGVCPGNTESAGKRKRGQTPTGSKSLRTALVEAAWAATRTTGTYLRAQYHRLVKRLPKKKALVAVAHTLLVIASHLLSRRVAYAELGRDHVDRQHVERQRRLVERLEARGVKVTIEEVAEAA
jgi:transposase